MSDNLTKGALPPLPGLVAGSLVAAGVLLWLAGYRELLILAGLGAFGPGILRELGFLRDHDEFQRQAAHRAGYHAYLVGGLAALLVLTFIEAGGGAVDESAEWLRLVVVILWLSWMFSSVLAYWGAGKTASRLLVSFGTFWAVFVAATLASEFSAVTSMKEFWMTMAGLGVGIGLVAPFYLLAWTASRRPKFTGWALLGVSAIFAVVFGPKGAMQWSAVVMRDVLILGPLVVSGIALVRDWGGDHEEPEPSGAATS